MGLEKVEVEIWLYMMKALVDQARDALNSPLVPYEEKIKIVDELKVLHNLLKGIEQE
jgi:hypothetical protein